MGDVITMHGRCIKCGRPHGQAVRSAIYNACDGCFAGMSVRADEGRRIFEGLIALGVERETANRMMIAWLGTGSATKVGGET